MVKRRNWFNDQNMIIIGVLLLGLIICLLIYYFNNDDNITFLLNGNESVSILQNEVFFDPLYIALDENGNDIRRFVTINSNVNTNIVGNYTISYVLTYNGKKKELIRNVIVLEDSLSKYEIRLNDNSPYYVKVGSEFIDPGYYVYNNETSSNANLTLEVKNNVNTNVVGKYSVEYILVLSGKEKKSVREVIVYDMNYSLNPSTLSNVKDKVDIIFDASSESDYHYIILPNGSSSLSNKVTYPVSKNGEYKFIIYDKYGGSEEKVVKISNIVENTPGVNFSCTGTVNASGTSLRVTGSDLSNVSEYLWNIDGVSVKGTSQYNVSQKSVNRASVKITLNGQSYNTACSIVNDLSYRFVYDEYFTKPYMSCNTYTASDRIRYESILKNAVSRAGYGTRAGVVEAARFLVGGLPHKVKYLGPKTVDTRLGRYNKVGLNIGYSDGWGCWVSGWEQGMDCTNFVNWAFVQAGLTLTGVYSTSNTYTSSSVVSRLRVGDLMLTPAESGTSNFTHVGIIIGIDSNYIYVAESTTGNVNAIVTTKWSKSNMPRSGKFSVAKLYTYPSEGNVTNMWVS